MRRKLKEFWFIKLERLLPHHTDVTGASCKIGCYQNILSLRDPCQLQTS